MRNLESIVAQPPISMISDSVDTHYVITGGNLYGWLVNCHGFLHNIGLIVPSLLFVVFLVVQAKKSFVKLSNDRSLVIIAYYGFLWLVALFNLAWCLLQVRFCLYLGLCFICVLILEFCWNCTDYLWIGESWNLLNLLVYVFVCRYG